MDVLLTTGPAPSAVKVDAHVDPEGRAHRVTVTMDDHEGNAAVVAMTPVQALELAGHLLAVARALV